MLSSALFHIKNQRARGFTLLETILVLLIAGIIIGGAWVTFSQAVVNDQVSRTLAGIDYTLSNARDFLAGKSSVPNTPTVFGIQLRNAGAYPSSFKPSGVLFGGVPVYITPIGGAFTVSVQPGNREFQFNIAAVNANICAKLAAALLGNPRSMQEHGIATYDFGTIVARPATLSPTQDEMISNCTNASRTQSQIALVYTMRP